MKTSRDFNPKGDRFQGFFIESAQAL